MAPADDALTVQARLAVAVAATLSYADIEQLLDDLKERAAGSGHVANAATAQLLAIAQHAAQYEPEADQHTPDEELSPAQRAARQAVLDRIIAEHEEAMREEGEGAPSTSEERAASDEA